jgi:putative endonuclease
MPIRIASLARQLHKNGQRLHLAMASRHFSKGPEHPADDLEQTLRDERDALKAEQKKRLAAAGQPKAKPVKVMKEAKAPKAPKAPKAAKPPKEAKAAKGNKPSRADKLSKKAENLEAAKKADRKSASKT